MSKKREPRYSVDEAIIAKSAACTKGMSCLEQGPACSVGAVVNGDTLIVDCRSKDTDCPFYCPPAIGGIDGSHGPCSCAVRLELREKFNL